MTSRPASSRSRRSIIVSRSSRSRSGSERIARKGLPYLGLHLIGGPVPALASATSAAGDTPAKLPHGLTPAHGVLVVLCGFSCGIYPFAGNAGVRDGHGYPLLARPRRYLPALDVLALTTGTDTGLHPCPLAARVVLPRQSSTHWTKTPESSAVSLDAHERRESNAHARFAHARRVARCVCKLLGSRPS
jgi:hypothetical protein